MAERRIGIEVDGVKAVATLHDDVCPKAAEAFWQTLPISATLTQSFWSGQACEFAPGGAALAKVTEMEEPVCSIYPGTIAVDAKEGTALISYGPAEYRTDLGTQYLSRVARIVEGRAELLKKIASLHDVGAKLIKVTRLA